jgi:hypothetical protein
VFADCQLVSRGDRSWVVTFKHLFDSVIYALLTAATFGWLWPKSLWHFSRSNIISTAKPRGEALRGQYSVGCGQSSSDYGSQREWSAWDARHRRQSCEGSSERAWAASKFQWSDRESRHGRHSRESNGRSLRGQVSTQLYGGRPRVFSSI